MQVRVEVGTAGHDLDAGAGSLRRAAEESAAGLDPQAASEDRHQPGAHAEAAPGAYVEGAAAGSRVEPGVTVFAVLTTHGSAVAGQRSLATVASETRAGSAAEHKPV